jgi:outer membrane protein assembly factor BamA
MISRAVKTAVLAIVLALSSMQLKGQSYCIVDTIGLLGNKITRDNIIYREMMFRPGDTLSVTLLDTLMQHSKENLMNTALFNFVEIDKFPAENDSTHMKVLVRVTERWYIWPVPILKISDRNFNVWWESKDWGRLSYGFYIDWKNFRGRRENLLIRFQYGYDQIYDFKYTKPFINKKETIGLNLGAGYWRNRETPYVTLDNKQDFYKDTAGYARDDIYAFTGLTLRPNIYLSHLFELRYDHHHFSDSLLAQNPHYSVNNANMVQYLTFHYMFKDDHRDYKSYPLKGYYTDFELIKEGLWSFKENTLNNLYLKATFRKYWQLDKRVYFATGINGEVTFGPDQPYFILRGIGWDRDVVRSYEYYVVNARDFIILKNNIKFALIPQTTRYFRPLENDRFGKFFVALYLDVFMDFGYGYYGQDFGWQTNNLQNDFLVGYGAGLDLVSYYDIVMRVECSINFMNEVGVFLHFRAPI